MTRFAKVWLVLLRLTLGSLFLYAGISKLTNASWSAAGYLANANTFPALYAWLATPLNIGWVNLINEWGLTLLGIALILGVFVRFAGSLGMLLMLLYYLPGLNFPYVSNGFLIDQHIIYIMALGLLITLRAGEIWGLDRWLVFKWRRRSRYLH
ncbi:DoxX family protein [Candidatus Uhrbacteria bacterium CG10_big_fil_rev_8_21_14_0_10_48_11]|uniref:DoxX family protein n=1 Tax=Candidatus Uhrbacteria bacterium CG10_big_fil_rev_8_21_14_0_10_48_11 TaxID=1975037 RepID=A0A2M8LEL5_9BACT|nr:MAG: DoxX family protein [Candidatus Uhrbacteria bacterium CG10_big_fil_rev_8_21_14_0_10_48_11]